MRELRRWKGGERARVSNLSILCPGTLPCRHTIQRSLLGVHTYMDGENTTPKKVSVSPSLCLSLSSCSTVKEENEKLQPSISPKTCFQLFQQQRNTQSLHPPLLPTYGTVMKTGTHARNLNKPCKKSPVFYLLSRYPHYNFPYGLSMHSIPSYIHFLPPHQMSIMWLPL